MDPGSAQGAGSGEGLNLKDRVQGVLYGNCLGDAIGLLTEFMTPGQAEKNYGRYQDLELHHKISDSHRSQFEMGDWTDDSDQMLLILKSILEHKRVDEIDFAKKMADWERHGYPELGDYTAVDVGITTQRVLSHPQYETCPHKAAADIWEESGRYAAPNGAVMRTSVLGVWQYEDISEVIQNTLNICKVTHADPRCQASCVAVTTAIAMMLQRNQKHLNKNGEYDIKAIMTDSFKLACDCLPDTKMHAELKSHMFASSIESLKLAEPGKIGYTYKTLGAGFWALQQKDFRKALEKIVRCAGDADTNGAVAGALLGCKLGMSGLPSSWVQGLKHLDWLESRTQEFWSLVTSTRRSETAAGHN